MRGARLQTCLTHVPTAAARRWAQPCLRLAACKATCRWVAELLAYFEAFGKLRQSRPAEGHGGAWRWCWHWLTGRLCMRKGCAYPPRRGHEWPASMLAMRAMPANRSPPCHCSRVCSADACHPAGVLQPSAGCVGPCGAATQCQPPPLVPGGMRHRVRAALQPCWRGSCRALIVCGGVRLLLTACSCRVAIRQLVRRMQPEVVRQRRAELSERCYRANIGWAVGVWKRCGFAPAMGCHSSEAARLSCPALNPWLSRSACWIMRVSDHCMLLLLTSLPAAERQPVIDSYGGTVPKMGSCPTATDRTHQLLSGTASPALSLRVIGLKTAVRTHLHQDSNSTQYMTLL